MSTVRWISAFIDLPPSSFEDGVVFWRAATGHELSARRGEHAEFATLLPPTGDAHLRVQRIAAGDPGIHLDLHVDDPRMSAEAAKGLGAAELADEGYVVMRSPGGFPFCFVPHHGEHAPAAPVIWPDGPSIVDQVCLDVPGAAYEQEARFWEQVTGWQREPDDDEEFTGLTRPDGMSLRLLVQRLGEPSGSTRAHFDVGAGNLQGEIRRHVSHGAERVADHDGWTIMRDPTGAAYCIVDRSETLVLS